MPFAHRGTAALALLTLGCGTPRAAETCDTLTWANTGAPVLTTWCTSCHSASSTGELRRGAPPGVDFDTLPGARSFARAIARTATGPAPTMPPSGGPTADERERLAGWLACGLPGEALPRESHTDCEGETWSGDWVAAADPPLCPGTSAVAGDVTVNADTDLSCLCTVQGAMELRGRTTELRLPRLAEVGGDLRVAQAASLQVLDAPYLHDLGGALIVENNPQLRTLQLWRLHTVGGEVSIAVNPALTTLAATSAIESVGGPLSVVDNDGLPLLDGFARVVAVDGPVLFAGNDAAEALHGFLFATHLDHPVSVTDHAQLRRITAFADLVEVTGPLQIRDNPALVEGPNVPWLTTVAGLTLQGAAHQRVPMLQSLTEIDGDLILSDNTALWDIEPLGSLTRVGGDLVATGNPELDPSERDEWLASVRVKGSIQTD
ncbi:MAG: hypothetical protein KTR31_12920 [Myxococcales bacterium]|nr:hypothetical protein [Myxococcales bacterium]